MTGKQIWQQCEKYGIFLQHVYINICAMLYLQNMAELETEYPWLYQQFTSQSFHSVR